MEPKRSTSMAPLDFSILAISPAQPPSFFHDSEAYSPCQRLPSSFSEISSMRGLVLKFAENVFQKLIRFAILKSIAKYVLLIQWLAFVGSAEAVHVGWEAVWLFRWERITKGQVLCGEKESLK